MMQAMQLTGGNVQEALALVEAKLGPVPTYDFVSLGNDGLARTTGAGDFEVMREPTQKVGDDGSIRQVGNSIVERQDDGSWKEIFTAKNPTDAARAFASFVNRDTGEQMSLMSDGTARGSGVNAYIPPQITSVGGVPNFVDKRTGGATIISPLEEVAGNKAAIASAEVQGQAQGKAAFDLPAIELRSQTAIDSISELKKLNIGPRYGAQSKVWAIPGTEGANIQARINQITSQAYLNAFDQLKGAGAITEAEGAAATAAITRLKDQNISVEEAFVAMNEMQTYYRKGIEVARLKATKAPTLPQRVPTAKADLSRISDEELDRLIAQGGGQ